MIFKIIFISILFLLFSGCSSKQSSISGIDKHVVESNELRLLMRELSSSVDDRHESELERDSIRRRYALRLSNSVKQFSDLVKDIPKESLGKDLDDKNMELFYTYAKELEEKAEVLYKIADGYELEKLNSAVNNMKITCNNCHKVFRNY